MHFCPSGRNKCSHQFLNWWQRYATGISRFNLSNPHPKLKKTDHEVVGLFWQRMRDSNPRKRSQSPVCYRYTNPLSHGQSLLYAQRRKSQALFSKTLHIFSAPFKASLSHNKSIMQLHRMHDCVSRQIKAQNRHNHT